MADEKCGKCACATSILGFYMETERAIEATGRLKKADEMTLWITPLKATYERMKRSCFGPAWEKVGDRLVEAGEELSNLRREESERLFFTKSKLLQAQTGLIDALGDWCRAGKE